MTNIDLAKSARGFLLRWRGKFYRIDCAEEFYDTSFLDLALLNLSVPSSYLSMPLWPFFELFFTAQRILVSSKLYSVVLALCSVSIRHRIRAGSGGQ